MSKIQDQITVAREYIKNKEWHSAKREFSEIIRQIDKYYSIEDRSQRNNIPEGPIEAVDKLDAINCHIAYLHAQLELVRTDRDTANYESRWYDVAKEVETDIESTESEIEAYQFSNQAELWNQLQWSYDSWGDERRQLGMKYQADALQYFMLKAKANRDWYIAKDARSFYTKLLAWYDYSGSWVEFKLYSLGMHLARSLVFLIVLPIFLYSLIYYWFGCLRNPIIGSVKATFWQTLYFSVFTFLGETGVLEITQACKANLSLYNLFKILTATEALWAFLMALIVVGYLVNRLSSR
jgi:hypothetical protein